MKTLIITLILLITSSVKSQSALVEQEKIFIIGTWFIDNEVTNKWVFTADNTCKWEVNGVILDQFTYSINNGFSSNGLEHTSLKLININNSNEVFEYEINSLGDNKMTLETVKPKHDFTFFTKE